LFRDEMFKNRTNVLVRKPSPEGLGKSGPWAAFKPGFLTGRWVASEKLQRKSLPRLKAAQYLREEVDNPARQHQGIFLRNLPGHVATSGRREKCCPYRQKLFEVCDWDLIFLKPYEAVSSIADALFYVTVARQRTRGFPKLLPDVAAHFAFTFSPSAPHAVGGRRAPNDLSAREGRAKGSPGGAWLLAEIR
jgi:hypothetical protein